MLHFALHIFFASAPLSRRLGVCSLTCACLIALVGMPAIGAGQPSVASPGAFDWGLNLPERAVPRRLTKVGPEFKGPDTLVVADLAGPGCIRRIWVTGGNISRDVVLRITFDGAAVPHIEAPLPDFFGVMHNLAGKGEPYVINTPFIDVKPANGMTCFFPMPFARSARIEAVGGSNPTTLLIMVDWHEYPGQSLAEPMRFCARWRREAPVRDYQDDYIMLDADGPGRLVGFAYSVDMLQSRQTMRWSHAGADNIYIDGGGLHPAFLRGIGGEDTFGVSYGGADYKPQSALFTDMPYYVQKDAQGDRQKLAAYRFFVHDSIRFDDSIHMRFGARAHDIASTVYWYSTKPVRPFFRMPPPERRLPGAEVRRGEFDLALPDTGSWWITGPFPSDFARMPPAGEFAAAQPWEGRKWQKFAALRGWVEFNHVYRPAPSNVNSPTLDATAFARCYINTPRQTTAQLTFAWDDELALQVNECPEVRLGRNSYLQSRTIEVPLRAGRNTVIVRLNNTVGLSRGAWNFSFRCVTPDGTVLVPFTE